MAAKRVVVMVEIYVHLGVQMVVCSAVARVDYLAAKRAVERDALKVAKKASTKAVTKAACLAAMTVVC